MKRWSKAKIRMPASSAGTSRAARRRGFSSQGHQDRQRDRGRLGGGKGHHLHWTILALVGACYILKCGCFSGVPLGQLGVGRQLAGVAGSKFCRVLGPGPATPNPWRLRSGQEGARTRTSRASSSTGTDTGADTEVAADYYEELKVDKGADIKAIKAAFRRLSKKLHPDVASDADCDKTKARFLRVVNAYNTLSDPIKRAKYDTKLGIVNLKGIVTEMFTFKDGTADSWGTATEMWGDSKSKFHVCSVMCDCGTQPMPSRPQGGTFATATLNNTGMVGGVDGWEPRGGGSSIDVEGSSTFQELLGLKERAEKNAKRRTWRQQKLKTCSSCGFLTEEGNAQCGACGQSVGSSPVGSQRGTRVTSVFTMHSVSQREMPETVSLGDDMLHELVHKNHFNPAHTRRPPPSAADDTATNPFEVDSREFKASATFQELLAMRECAAAKVASARQRSLLTCPSCGFLTEDGASCSACGVGIRPSLTSQRTSITPVFTMHSKGKVQAGSAMGEDDMHSLVHKNHFLPQRPPLPARAAPEAQTLGDFFTGGGDSGGFGVGSVQFAEERSLPSESKVSVCGNCGCYTSFACGKCGACGSEWFRSDSASAPGPTDSSAKEEQGIKGEGSGGGFATLRELNAYLEGGGQQEKTEEEWEGVLSDEMARAADKRDRGSAGSAVSRNRWKMLESQFSPWLGTSAEVIGEPSEPSGDAVGESEAVSRDASWMDWRDVMLDEDKPQEVYGMFAKGGSGNESPSPVSRKKKEEEEEEEEEVLAVVEEEKDGEDDGGLLTSSAREMMGRNVDAKRREIDARMASLENQIEDLGFFISHMSAYSDRVREEARRAAVLVKELEEEAQLSVMCIPEDGAVAMGGVTRCNLCGCDSLDPTRCDACGTLLEGFAEQRGSGHTGVYTMHGGTRLGHDDRHSLVHKNHFEQDTEGLSGMAENDAGLDWLVQGSFGLSRESIGALPGQRIRKENCESCVELEQMLAKGKSKTMREGAYKRYMKLGNEALRKHRESQNLDLVVAKKMEQLAALQRELDGMLSGMREIERLLGAMSDIGADGLGPGCDIDYGQDEDGIAGVGSIG